MTIYENIPLKSYNTFGVDYTADCMIHVDSDNEAIDLFRGKTIRGKQLLILGGGSNILFTGNFKGTIIRPEFGGIKIEEKDKDTVTISAGAGINWDTLVEWTVNNGFGGLENLSLIPGLTGATPVQNIGAYGVEVKDKIVKVKTISINDGSLREFSNTECKFDYRNSIFKNHEKGRYLITRVYYKLNLRPKPDLNYGSLKEEVIKTGSITLQNVRQAVINIRKSKLPDPEILGNAGSFFKNPVISISLAENLRKIYRDMPSYSDRSGGIKLAAGWLIDQCGWKGKRVGDTGVHDKQALILVNYGKATGKEIFKFSEKIKESVFEKFGIELEREVEVL